MTDVKMPPIDPVHLLSLNEPPGSEVLVPTEPAPKTAQPAKPQPEMPQVSRDPDDIEEEIEAAKADGEVKTSKKPGKR